VTRLIVVLLAALVAAGCGAARKPTEVNLIRFQPNQIRE
jgi:hypothetical protein